MDVRHTHTGQVGRGALAGSGHGGDRRGEYRMIREAACSSGLCRL